jgi:hypothetical protein
MVHDHVLHHHPMQVEAGCRNLPELVILELVGCRADRFGPCRARRAERSLLAHTSVCSPSMALPAVRCGMQVMNICLQISAMATARSRNVPPRGGRLSRNLRALLLQLFHQRARQVVGGEATSSSVSTSCGMLPTSAQP